MPPPTEHTYEENDLIITDKQYVNGKSILVTIECDHYDGDFPAQSIIEFHVENT